MNATKTTLNVLTAEQRANMTATELSNYIDSQPLQGILILGQPVTRAQLSIAFNLVSDKTNWKNPINRELILTGQDVAMIRTAVQFFAGCVPTFSVLAGRVEFDGKGNPLSTYNVKAAGYYAAVGA